MSRSDLQTDLTPQRNGLPDDPLSLAVRRSRILVVDDEPSNFALLRKVLSDDGYSNVASTTDSVTALQTIKETSPDLVILDVFMPVVDGLQLLEMIRRDPEVADTAVVILTASDDPEIESRASDLGIMDFLRKPVLPSELVSRVYYALTSHIDFEVVEQGPATQPVPEPIKEVVAPPAADFNRMNTPTVSNLQFGPASGYVTDERIRQSRIVIVDDEPFNFMVLRKFLSDEGYSRVLTTSESTTAVDTIQKANPDLVILDIIMPEVDGIQILTRLKADPELSRVPVLILTATSDSSLKREALELGATDFLNKPVDSHDLLPRVRNAIMFKLQQDQMRDYAGYLEDQVRIRTTELIESRRDIVRCLARAGEFRDTQTGLHVLRVGLYAGIIAEELGFAPTEVEDIELAAQLHDLGKIAIPDAILLKPGKLTETEMQEMRRHCRIGMKIIQPNRIGGRGRAAGNPNRLTQMAAMIASTHHEHWDGNGYPSGLRGEQIPIEGRITAVADVFDALSSARPYKDAFRFDECFEILEGDRGKQFDPAVLDALLARRDEIINIRTEHADVVGT